MVARQVNRDAKEPGADFCLAAKDAAALVGPQKTLLCKGVGEIAIAHNAQQDAINAPLIQTHNLVKLLVANAFGTAFPGRGEGGRLIEDLFHTLH